MSSDDNQGEKEGLLRLRLLHREMEPSWMSARTQRSFAPCLNLRDGTILVRSGCWLRQASLQRLQHMRTWGQDVIVIGLDDSDRSKKLIRKYGGDFGRRKGWRSPFGTLPPVCIFPGGVRLQLRGGFEEKCRVALELLRSGRHRVVHVPELDVGWDQRLRVVQVVTSIQRGGAEKIALELAEGLEREGCASLLVSLGKGSRPEYAPKCWWIDLSPAVDREEVLHRTLRVYGADLVHGHLLSREWIGRMKVGGWPMVTTLHNSKAAWPEGVPELTRAEMDLVIACSKRVEEEADYEMPVRTIWNGVSVQKPFEDRGSWRRRLGAGDGDLVLLALANLRPQKNFDLLPAILGEVQSRLKSGRKCHLWIAGAGSLEKNWPEGVRAVGCIEDTSGFLKSGDVLVCPSRHEGLSLVQLEALSVGTHVVATRVGGASEVSGVTTVDPEASAATYADAVLAVIDDVPPTLPLSFKAETMVRRHRFLYEGLAESLGDVSSHDGLWIVTNHLGTGGAQTSAVRLLCRLHGMGIRVKAAVMEEAWDQPSVGTLKLRKEGITVWSYRSQAGYSSDALEQCAALVREMSRDVGQTVFFWNLRPVCKVLLADALIRMRIWDVSPGEMNFDSLTRYFENPMPGLPYRNPLEYGRRLSGAVVKFSGESARAQKTLGCRIEVIANGIDPGLDNTNTLRRTTQVRFLTVARLSPDKRLEQLVEAWRMVEPRLDGCVSLHIGGGEDGEKNRQYAEQLRRYSRGLRVKWHGHQEDVSGFLSQGSAFVLISEPAGCPNAGLEALAAGLALVATDHGGASEQVVDEWNGFLVPRGDVAALADRILELAADPALRERMGENSRKLVLKRFSMDQMAERYLELIAHVRMPRTTLPETSVSL